ncbi:hypothetical protein, partial [Oleiphilus sp. HI0080]|uniref:hypothetical protein n=1 Tax=Oleiphilus sp. HI0080 TaxID=1822255 RepID=UPI000AB8CD62
MTKHKSNTKEQHLVALRERNSQLLGAIDHLNSQRLRLTRPLLFKESNLLQAESLPSVQSTEHLR